MSHAYKQIVDKTALPVRPTIRELVAKHGDLWYCFADRAYLMNVSASPDRHDAMLMERMERGTWPRVED